MTPRFRFAALNIAFATSVAVASLFPAPAWADVVKVVATFSVLGDLVKNVGGEHVDVTVLVPPDGDAHTYQPTPSDARAVGAAAAMVTNGLGLEGWLPRLMGATQFKGKLIVASTGIKPLSMEEEVAEGKPKPAKPKRVSDPHAWQNLANGQIYVDNIVKGLSAADPADAAAFASAGAAYKQQLAALDAKVREMVAAVPKEKRRVITTHDAFQYYGKAYGVQFLAPVGISTENEPSAGDLARLERQIKRDHIKALFLENVTSSQMITQIAKDTGGIVGPPLFSDALSKPDEPAPTYVKMFEHNTATLVEGMRKN
jgi:zinc/manganese transport system substrate-binding protein